MQFAQATHRPKIAKELALSRQRKIVLKKSPNASKKIKIHRHTTRQTHQKMTLKLNLDKAYSDKVDKRPAGNSAYKKLAVQELNKALCFISSSAVADSFRLRNRQLLVAANLWWKCSLNEINRITN